MYTVGKVFIIKKIKSLKKLLFIQQICALMLCILLLWYQWIAMHAHCRQSCTCKHRLGSLFKLPPGQQKLQHSDQNRINPWSYQTTPSLWISVLMLWILLLWCQSEWMAMSAFRNICKHGWNLDIAIMVTKMATHWSKLNQSTAIPNYTLLTFVLISEK